MFHAFPLIDALSMLSLDYANAGTMDVNNPIIPTIVLIIFISYNIISGVRFSQIGDIANTIYHLALLGHDVQACISFRDISAIIKKKESAVNGGNGDGNDNNNYNNNYSHSNEKSTQPYKIFSESKKPVQVAIELGLREK
jgi:hypothetical protein